MKFFLAIICVISVLSLGIAITQTNSVNITNNPESTPPVDPFISSVQAMPLEEKIGQMLIVGFENSYADEHIRKMIQEYHIGGINLLARNVKDREQVQKLTADLQNLARIPLLIGTDQEGGSVIRFKFLKELTPQLSIKTTTQAKQVALNRARELKELGINMNFSPVLDYVSNTKSYLYNRTFGASPEITGKLGQAMIAGYVEGGVVPVAKHFPGYGNIIGDPHRKIASTSLSSEELEKSLLPFRKALENPPTNAIMTAHIAIPFVDPKPATLSPKFLSDILRKQMGFAGVIITDDMEMGAVGGSIEETAVEAVKAGVDMLISTYTPAVQIRILDRLKKAVLEGEISEERINESALRIAKLKSAL